MKSCIPLTPVLAAFLVGCSPHQAAVESQPQQPLPAVKTQITDRPDRIWIKPVNLPQPFASPSASQPPQVIPRPENAQLSVPKGFQVSVFMEGLSRPRWLTVTPNGDVLVAESYDHRIRLLRDTNGDGKADVNTVLLKNLNQPLGMAVAPNQKSLYIANTDAIVRFPYQVGQTRIDDQPQVITPLPGQGYRQHWTRNLKFGPEGKRLFVSVGSRSNAEVEALPRASIQMMDLQGRDQWGSLQTYASGLRNPVGLDFHPKTQQLFTTVNERDGLGDDLVPDYLTSVQANGFYGWPYTYLGKNRDPRLPERPQLAARTLVPEVLFQSHSAALGLVFYTGKQFPKAYHQDAFVAFRGSWNRSQGTGYKVVRVPFDDQGQPQGYYEDFVTGWLADPAVPSVWGRPVGLAVAEDGTLLIADEAGGVIWRVSYARPG